MKSFKRLLAMVMTIALLLTLGLASVANAAAVPVDTVDIELDADLIKSIFVVGANIPDRDFESTFDYGTYTWVRPAEYTGFQKTNGTSKWDTAGECISTVDSDGDWGEIRYSDATVFTKGRKFGIALVIEAKNGYCFDENTTFSTNVGTIIYKDFDSWIAGNTSKTVLVNIEIPLTEKDVPKTGDSTPVALLCVLTLVAAAGCLLLRRKQREA